MADEAIDRSDDRDDEDEREDRGERERARVERPARATGGFFDVYKRGQGQRVRLGTAVTAGILVVWGAMFLYQKLTAYDLPLLVGFGIPTLFLVGAGLVAYHFLARSVKAVDFLIATEGEMKKVHWSSRREVIGSTKVVIIVVVVMGVTMFLVDVGLMFFFTEIGVLRIGRDVINLMFGG